jgi:hypothetical protein
MTWDNIKDIGLFALATYGAVLSTITAVKTFRKDKRSIKVNCGQKYPVYGSGIKVSDVVAHITATNIGSRSVTITQLGLLMPDRKRLVSIGPCQISGMEDTPLRATLADGESAEMHLSYLNIASNLMKEGYGGQVRLIPFCEDSAGGLHQGAVWKTSAEKLIECVKD